MKFLEKLGYGKGWGEVLRVHLVQWFLIAFLVFGPLVWRGMDRLITRLCINMAAAYKPYISVMFGVAILIWGFQLFMSYHESRAPKFEMEPLLDRQKAELEAEGKSAAWVETFRQDYRRHHFIGILANGVTAAVLIMYYQIWLFLIFVIRHKLVVMKDGCGTPSFLTIEKIYLSQYLNDLPFKLSELINIFGCCRPDDDVMAIRVINSLANLLHWALIIGVVGFIWGKQIKQWLFAR